MNQSKRESLIEAATNIVIGFAINFVVNFAILPLAGLPMPSAMQNLAMGAMFTVVSIGRMYLIRRFFETKLAALKRYLVIKTA